MGVRIPNPAPRSPLPASYNTGVQERLLAYIRKHDLMRAGERVGVAVSGGADSVALLRLLLDLRAQLGVVLAVVHFNHQLRGEESEGDEALVRSLASEHDLEFHGDTADTRTYAQERGCGIEAAARELRYSFFRKLLPPNLNTLDRIATAHTMDDQAETVLMRFTRGAGTRGLAGIHPTLFDRTSDAGLAASGGPNSQRPQPNDHIPTTAVVRPLLEFRRAQLRHYLRRAAQAWREDASNQDMAFARNRIRQEVMPKLRGLNPAVEQVLSETAEIARAEEEYWNDIVNAVLEQVTAEAGDPAAVSAPTNHRLHIPGLLRTPLALQRRVVREFAGRQGVRLEFHHVQQVLDMAREEPTRREKRMELPGNWDAFLVGSELRLEQRGQKAEKQDYEFPLPVPGEVWIALAGVRVTARMAQVGSRLKACELRVRNWRPGDRYWPAHMATEKKLKELLQDRRVPAEARAHWPVVIAAATGQILWVPGFAYPEGWATEGEPGVVLEAETRARS